MHLFQFSPHALPWNLTWLDSSFELIAKCDDFYFEMMAQDVGILMLVLAFSIVYNQTMAHNMLVWKHSQVDQKNSI
jgi:hypothetical protein